MIEDKSRQVHGNKNSIIYFACLGKERYATETLSTDKILNKEYFLWKNHIGNVHQKLVPDPFLIWVNKPK